MSLFLPPPPPFCLSPPWTNPATITYPVLCLATITHNTDLNHYYTTNRPQQITTTIPKQKFEEKPTINPCLSLKWSNLPLPPNPNKPLITTTTPHTHQKKPLNHKPTNPLNQKTNTPIISTPTRSKSDLHRTHAIKTPSERSPR